MRSIRFFKNWNNKLNCDYFTTICPAWYDGYYNVGESYDIILCSKKYSTGKLVALRYFMLKDLNDYIAYLDAGINAEQLKEQIIKMYPNKDFTVDKLCFLLINNTSLKTTNI